MNKKLNNKGYMLVEIILAFVIAMGITYFMFELIIKLKNKNDDLIVKTLVATDQAIIYNTIMKDLYENDTLFGCNKIAIEGNKFRYDKDNDGVRDFIIDISEYVDEVSYNSNDEAYCKKDDNGMLAIKIPIKVDELSDDFSVKIMYEIRYPE